MGSDRPAAGQGEVLQEADRGGRGDRRPQPGQVPQGCWSSWGCRGKRRRQRAGNGNEEGSRQVCFPRSLNEQRTKNTGLSSTGQNNTNNSSQTIYFSFPTFSKFLLISGKDHI